MVSNTSDEEALDKGLIFNRFYRPSEKVKGNGLGLAIVKAVCDYHGWKISYIYSDGNMNLQSYFCKSSKLSTKLPVIFVILIQEDL